MNLEKGNIGELIQEDKVHLKRQLGLHHAICVVCGSIIGSAIYITPQTVIAGTGSAGLCMVIWAIAGVQSLAGALSFADLGTALPGSGSHYHYLMELYGSIPAFLFAWQMAILVRPSSDAIKCLTFASYLIQLFFPTCQPPKLAQTLLAIILTWTLIYINIRNIRGSAGLQVCICLISTGSLLMISCLGIVWLIKGKNETFRQPFLGTSSDIGAIMFALYGALYGYSGWHGLNFITEELKNPKKYLPFANGMGIFIVIVLYLLTNLSYLVILGPDGMLASEAVAMDVARLTIGGAAWVIGPLVCITLAGGANTGIFKGSRLVFVGGRSGHLPSALGMISAQHKSPIVSLMSHGILITLYTLTSDIFFLLNNMTFLLILTDGLCVAGLLYHRYMSPQYPRPNKIPYVFHAIFLGFMPLLLGIPMLTRPRQSLAGLLLVGCTGLPLYIFSCWRNKPEFISKWTGMLTRLIQMLALCCPDELH